MKLTQNLASRGYDKNISVVNLILILNGMGRGTIFMFNSNLVQNGFCQKNKLQKPSQNISVADPKITGCCKTSGQLWKPIADAFFEVFLMFLGSFDCQLWAIFHFGTLYA